MEQNMLIINVQKHYSKYWRFEEMSIITDEQQKETSIKQYLWI